MKKISILIALLICAAFCKAQATPGPAEVKMTNALCDCITKLDKSKLKGAKEANAAFMDCFGEQADLIPDVAAERKVEISDGEAMKKIGKDIAENLMRLKCDGFMQLAVKMAGKDEDSETETVTQATTGTFKRIDTKGFNYFVLTDAAGSERSFIWLKQFPGSEQFMGPTVKFAGKNLKVTWQEMEVYLPPAKGYYKVKEIVSVDIL
ncbi:hypothetical protein [Mucilaginibacter sp. AK015]|uniref:hypothetical protein n=1 Tax=Mucilaginibacter sp. AK015 TaxID=2723072 RepID=UPI0016083535|nr:hypothetical protein [Mucilaginibacter sp. AK015]MBB5395930.1 hypothetical protein [Mucilaginibacter sp. AK015]